VETVLVIVVWVIVARVDAIVITNVRMLAICIVGVPQQEFIIVSQVVHLMENMLQKLLSVAILGIPQLNSVIRLVNLMAKAVQPPANVVLAIV